MRRILLIIPTYQEADNILPLVTAIHGVFKPLRQTLDPEILFVDDTSPDGTAERIHELGLMPGKIHVLSGHKAGLGRAYLRGLAWAQRAGGYDSIIMMDADLSHDPADIPRLLAEIADGADYVIGSRYVSGGRMAAGYSRSRQLQSRLANLLAVTLIDLPSPPQDMTAGFKAIRLSALQRIPLRSIRASGYVFQVSLLYQFMKHGYDVREVPTTFHPRARGVSKLGWRDIIEFVVATYRLNPSARLQRFVRFGLVGASGTAVNLVILISLVRLAHTPPRLAYIAALEGSIVSNFVLNHLFTFEYSHTEGRWHRFGLKLITYNVVSLLGAAIAWTAFSVSTQLLGVHYVAADLIGIGLAMGWNYWLSVRVVWPLADERDHVVQKV